MTGDLETSAITWGGTRLPYAIRRSARRKKTVAVTVDPAGDVLLVAPESFSTSRLDAVVRRKAAWIVRRRRHVQSHDPPPSSREFVSGESVQYLGRHYRLKVHPNEAGQAKLRGGWLHVPAPAGAQRTAHVRQPSCPGSAVTRPSGYRSGSRFGERRSASRCPASSSPISRSGGGVATVAAPSG